MAITRRVIATDDNDTDWLRMDHSQRYIQNSADDWQFVFGPNSSLNTSTQVLKISAQLDTSTLDKIRVAAYLYNSRNGSIDSAAGIDFKIHRVEDISSPKWNDNLILTEAGILQSNNYYFKEIPISSLTGVTLDGDTSLMIEATATRSGVVYRDRIYFNHLGVYDSIVRLRQDVEWLDISKLDE